MKRAVLAILPLLAAAMPCVAEEEESQAERDGEISRILVSMLENRHVLRQRFDDSMSQRAWTNLMSIYDADHAVFLAEDVRRLSAHEFTIDDEIKSGDVSFGREVYDIYCRRLNERVAFATNLVVNGTPDFSVDETYSYKRENDPWPETREDADELWRRRIKNELLVTILSRELDAEEAAAETDKTAAAVSNDVHAAVSGEPPATAASTNAALPEIAADAASLPAEASTNATDELPPEPLPTPGESVVKRYRALLTALTQSDDETILQTYLSAVSRACDPHTDYMSPMTKEDFDMDMNLKLCGVGAVLSFDDGMIKIVEIMPGGPMGRDGRIKEGDKIVGVQQEGGRMEDVMWQPLRKTVHKIRGEKGTRVTLEIVPRNDPAGTSRKRIELVRDEIQLDDQRTTGRVERVSMDAREFRIGYVHVPEFYGSMDRNPGDEGYVSCANDVLQYIKRFNTENSDGMILDLRGNGGGSLPEALRMSALFVPSGPVVLVRDAVSSMPLQIDRNNTVAYRKPVIVLIDRSSASASEIVAGHLRDVGRAIVLGDSRTHGKGTVQSVMPVGSERDGYGSAKITTMRFYRVNGDSTQVKGVASDIHLPSFLDSLEIGEEKLPYALPFSHIRPPRVRKAWNLPDYVPRLADLSAARTAKNERYQKHVRNVADYKAFYDRVEVPLERGKRKAQMKSDRSVRELEENGGDGDEDESSGDKPRSSRRRARTRSNDIVLDEAFNIMVDLVNLTGGANMPPAPIDWYNAILGF